MASNAPRNQVHPRAYLEYCPTDLPVTEASKLVRWSHQITSTADEDVTSSFVGTDEVEDHTIHEYEAGLSTDKDSSQLETSAATSPTTLTSTPKTNRLHAQAPFPLREDLNDKIALATVDISSLNTHAIVHCTNERFNSGNPAAQRILARGGPHLRHTLVETVKICRTGDAKLTEGHNLPARYVIHTVGPKFNSKYVTAARSALYSCYSKTLSLALESHSATLALGCVHSSRRGFPPEEGAHIALRTVRKFLENHGTSLDLIVFCMEPTVEERELAVYRALLPLYFPRTVAEEELARERLPLDLGGPNGEPLIPERQIRIMDKPQGPALHSNTYEDKENVSGPEENNSEEREDLDNFAEDEGDQWTIGSVEVDLTSGLETSVPVGRTAFARMTQDVDQMRLARSATFPMLTSRQDPLSEELQRLSRYERLLRRSRIENLSAQADAGWFHHLGNDRQGRPLVMILGRELGPALAHPQSAVLYLISQMDRLVDSPYVMVYFHTLVTRDTTPSYTLVENVYDHLDHRYKKNLVAFYIVHPTLWTRLASWWFGTWTASSVRRKMFLLGGVEYLDAIAPMVQFALPSYIQEYDLKMNGLGYALPIRYSSTSSSAHEAGPQDRPAHPFI